MCVRRTELAPAPDPDAQPEPRVVLCGRTTKGPRGTVECDTLCPRFFLSTQGSLVFTDKISGKWKVCCWGGEKAALSLGALDSVQALHAVLMPFLPRASLASSVRYESSYIPKRPWVKNN